MVTERRPIPRAHAAEPKRKAKKPFDAFAYLLRMSKQIPEEELAALPRDLAYNFDHYHDGSPKQP